MLCTDSIQMLSESRRHSGSVPNSPNFDKPTLFHDFVDNLIAAMIENLQSFSGSLLVFVADLRVICQSKGCIHDFLAEGKRPLRIVKGNIFDNSFQVALGTRLNNYVEAFFTH